ncbi:EPSP synthase family protein [Neorickettsia helminthoeca str. Oregon]|uniref:EPSP synthase family protein n=1 Tax=Neorickettsia helminthoeca str. Oregon TaxID=1286528 RepID=X5HJ85_9RICK|nr:EPSP synthase family protein [Neorickettsia helminthoeca str. Oregon]
MGKSTISPSFISDSTVSTMCCLQHLGVEIKRISDSRIEVYGVGVRGLSAPTDVLNIGNSRIAMHLLLGVVASYSFQTIITGYGHFLDKFKIKGVKHFSDIGIEITSCTLPTIVKGNDYCVPHIHILEHSCSQIKSALLMAGLNTKGTTTIVEPFSGSTNHTELMLKHLGADITIIRSKENTKTTICGIPELRPQDIIIPGDPSITLFLVAAATLIPGSEITIEGICLNEDRLRVYRILREMSADINTTISGKNLGNKIGSINVKSARLNGVTIKESDISIDNFQILLFLLCTANGKSSIENNKGLKISSKLHKFIEIMQELGAIIEVTDTSINIEGTTLDGGKSINARYDYLLGNILILSGFVSRKPITMYNYRPHWFDLYYNADKVKPSHNGKKSTHS